MGDNKKISEEMFDKDIRVGSIIHLASQCSDIDAISSGGSDALEFNLGKILKCLNLDDMSLEDFLENIVEHNTWGFIVSFETPIMQPIVGIGYNFSWSSYQEFWVYSESVEGAYKQGLEWQRKYLEEREKGIYKKVEV